VIMFCRCGNLIQGKKRYKIDNLIFYYCSECNLYYNSKCKIITKEQFNRKKENSNKHNEPKRDKPGITYDKYGRVYPKITRVVKYSKYNPLPYKVKKERYNSWVKNKCNLPTKSGIMVQSHGEKLIADFLWDNNIDFDYDILIEFGKNETPDYVLWARPDFIIKGTNIFIEYWGLKYGKSAKPSYDKRVEKKIALYEQEEIRLIEVFCEDLKVFGCKLLKEDLIEAKLINYE